MCSVILGSTLPLVNALGPRVGFTGLSRDDVLAVELNISRRPKSRSQDYGILPRDGARMPLGFTRWTKKSSRVHDVMGKNPVIGQRIRRLDVKKSTPSNRER